MRIIINERQEKMLVNFLLKESEGDRNLEVFKWLDNHFMKGSYDSLIGGYMQPTKVVIWLDGNKQPTKNAITSERLFDIVQDRFSSFCSNEEERDKVLHDIVDAWLGINNKSYNKDTGNILI